MFLRKDKRGRCPAQLVHCLNAATFELKKAKKGKKAGSDLRGLQVTLFIYIFTGTSPSGRLAPGSEHFRLFIYHSVGIYLPTPTDPDCNRPGPADPDWTRSALVPSVVTLKPDRLNDPL